MCSGFQKHSERDFIMDWNSFFYLCDSVCPAGVRPMKIHFVPHDTFHNFFFFQEEHKEVCG